jgi:hypothetical protein
MKDHNIILRPQKVTPRIYPLRVSNELLLFPVHLKTLPFKVRILYRANKLLYYEFVCLVYDTRLWVVEIPTAYSHSISITQVFTCGQICQPLRTSTCVGNTCRKVVWEPWYRSVTVLFRLRDGEIVSVVPHLSVPACQKKMFPTYRRSPCLSWEGSVADWYKNNTVFILIQIGLCRKRVKM